ncbi:uncharacterized protein LOC135709228 [Ochlerotatus camptorhynchus]|uniref:uncharacterized protein LOC135709228 n=1 Tax=Ochlerotatus camptorhynchus TaxID=644619 RepID=UPI0031E3E9EA
MEESQQLHFPVHHNYNGNGNNNKPLNVSGHDGSGQLADSGYTSYHSFNASCSVARSVVLATIEEDNEADISFEEARSSADISQVTSNILTPSTAASIERISNFHLTTPNSAGKQVEQRRHLARKPTYENLVEKHTPKKAGDVGCFGFTGKCDLGSLTPRKNKEPSKRKFGQFREKLYSDGDARQQAASGGLDDSLEEDCKKLDQGDISPIFHAKRRRNSVIDNLIRSSTPKTASLRSNFHVGGRENIDWEAVDQGKAPGPMRKPLRKFQSFSPSKMHSYGKRDSVLQEKSVITNRKAPLKRQNALRESSLKQDSSSFSTPRKSKECSVEQSFELSPEIPITPQTQANFGALLDAPILVQTSAEPDLKETYLDQEISQIPSFDDYSCPVTPGRQKLPSEDSCVIRDAPVSIAVNIPSILENESLLLGSLTIPKTPTSTNKSRNRVKRLSSTKKDKPRSKPPSPIHRAQPVIPGSNRPSYVGVERLNILKRLNKLDKDSLGIILDYLTDSDLVRVVAVSSGWRRIVEEHRRTHRRLRDHLAREVHVKENLDRTGSTSISSRDSSLLWKTASVVSSDGGKEFAPASIQRQPFSLCNSIDGNQSAGGELRRFGSVQKSPPVSPSKRKFRENQKIASHLKRSERLKPCPRCEKPSRVVLTKSSIKQALATGSLDSSTVLLTVVGGKLEKSYTLPESLIDCTAAESTIIDSPASPINSDRIRKNLFSTSLLPRSQSVDVQTPVARTPRRRISTDALGSSASLLERKLTTRNGKSKSAEGIQCDYAVCSGKSCGFTFCIKCLCEYHPNSVCIDLAPNSPSKEDEPAHNVACSKQSRRSLLRLRK